MPPLNKKGSDQELIVKRYIVFLVVSHVRSAVFYDNDNAELIVRIL